MPEQAANLVARAQQGDAQAYSALYEQYAPLICRFLSSRVDGSYEAAEDLTSTVFLKVWQKLSLYVDRGLPFEAWVFRIARNCLTDYRRRQPRYVSDPLDLAANVSVRDASLEYGQVLDRQILEAALDQLGAVQRQTVTLRFLEGLSAIETGVLMDRSTDAVKKLQARALVNLRRILSPARQVVADLRRIPVAA